MRVSEIISETQDTETEVTKYKGVPMKITELDDEVVVKALDSQGNKVLGHVTFNRFHDDLEAKYVEVDERYRGQGIAELMYDFATYRGYKISRSWDQTDAGAAFWNKHRGEEETVWEDDLDEAPLADYEPIGNFNKPGPFRGPDKKLVPHPVNQLKAAKFFEHTPYDFRLFFSNISGTGRYSEYGPMRPEVVQQVFGQHAQHILAGGEDAITVVFVGNKGDSKVMMTPWIMAHRIGHAIQAGERKGERNGAWRAAEQHFFRAINELLKDFYNKQAVNQFSSTHYNTKQQPEYAALFNAIGTQRSSRTGQITRPYEFMYELFAQYLGTGKITLNPLPKQKGYGKQAWGKHTKQMNLQPDTEEDSAYTTDVLSRDMELMFDDVLSSIVGQVLVM